MPPTFHIARLNRYTPNFSGVSQKLTWCQQFGLQIFPKWGDNMKHFAAVIIIYSSLKFGRSTLCDAKSLESDVEAGASSGMLIQVCFCETPNGRKHDLLSQSSWQKFRSRFRDTPSSFPNKTLVAVPFGTPKHFLRLRYTSPSQPEFLTFVVEFPLLFCTVTAMDVLIQKYRGKSRINH